MINKLEILPMIDDREVEMVREDHYVKYIYQRNTTRTGGSVFISAGQETDVGEVLQSVFAIIYTVFQGLKNDGSERADEDAMWLKQQVLEKLNDDRFWEDDGARTDYIQRNDSLSANKKMS